MGQVAFHCTNWYTIRKRQNQVTYGKFLFSCHLRRPRTRLPNIMNPQPLDHQLVIDKILELLM